MEKIATLAFLVFYLMCTAEALQCYSCSGCNTVSASQLVTCGDNSTTEPPTNSTGNSTQAYEVFFKDGMSEEQSQMHADAYECGKIVIKDSANNVTTFRSCVPVGAANDCILLSQTNAVSKSLEICNADGCNSATALKISLLGIAFISSVLSVYNN